MSGRGANAYSERYPLARVPFNISSWKSMNFNWRPWKDSAWSLTWASFCFLVLFGVKTLMRLLPAAGKWSNEQGDPDAELNETETDFSASALPVLTSLAVRCCRPILGSWTVRMFTLNGPERCHTQVWYLSCSSEKPVPHQPRTHVIAENHGSPQQQKLLYEK